VQAVLAAESLKLIEDARKDGWVLEPNALRLLSAAGVPVPRFAWAETAAEAQTAADRIGYPVAAKVVSAQILHKSEVGGVRPGIADATELSRAWDHFSRLPGFAGVLVAEMLAGHELIVGAKLDFQFGPVILMGIGGTAVEVYQDTVTRMAPLTARDVPAMLACLRGRRLLTGHRGSEAVDVGKLTELVLAFSALVMDFGERFESIDLNPVFCSSQRCVVADARILLPPAS
jgi:acetate---CoA ligase (ADP-forming) subunit beta